METLTSLRMKTSIPTITEINKNFVIRWRYYDEESTSFDRLIGAGKYAEKFGEKYMEKHFVRAFESGLNKTVFGIRGKYIITFSAK
jgi:hypothetical protein